MKIAQIAPLAESVPPRLYGGTERVVACLTNELMRLGHDVTLFGSGDSVTRARLVACTPAALRLNAAAGDPLAPLQRMVEQVRARAQEYDVLHFHIDPPLHFPLFHAIARRTVTTLHGRLDLPEVQSVLRGYAGMPLVSISDSQRRPVPDLNWLGTVHHGLPPCGAFNPAPSGRYFAFLGRVSPEKGLDRAIALTRRAGAVLRIAAKVDPVDENYYRVRIVPLLGGPVQFLGEIGEGDKADFLGNAAGLLFLVNWPEPFGLAQIEAMACGTPVLAWRNGAVPEIVEDGVTGFIVDSLDAALARLPLLARLDRAQVRRRFEARFLPSRMAREYLGVYRALRPQPAAITA